MKEVAVRNRTRESTVGTRIAIADTPLTRLAGLLGRRRLDAGCGMLIRPASGIHTMGMLFPIDVIALDSALNVLRLWHRLAPFRVTPLSFKTYSMLELPAGRIRESNTQVGDQLQIISRQELAVAVEFDPAERSRPLAPESRR